MTVPELRETDGYKKAFDKIKGYPKGFKFTLDYTKIPKAKGNALKIITRDCLKEKIIESVAIGLSLEGEQTEETFRRL